MKGEDSQKEHKHELGKKKYIREAIFGFNDGLVSTFALVSGAAGASFSHIIIAFIGFISAFAGALSMGFGTYISTKSQIEVYRGEIRKELKRIEENPLSEKNEIKKIFIDFGFKGKELERIVKKITKNKTAWLSLLAHEEIGISGSEFKNPLMAAFIIFGIFLLGAAVPVLPYVFLETSQAMIVSVVFGALSLFLIGAVKTKLTKRNWIKSGIEMIIIGLTAAALVYYIGSIVGAYV